MRFATILAMAFAATIAVPAWAANGTITAGLDHTCALNVTGGVRCWGDNTFGQLGDGTITDRSVPTLVSGLASGVQAIVADGYHTCALSAAGAVQCWGGNFSGQLGDGTNVARHTPVAVSALGTGVQALAAGYNHTCAITAAGAVRCWGDNQFGQLGDGTVVDSPLPVAVMNLISGVKAITAGYYHSCALTAAGGAQCWGQNESRQIGDGTLTLRPIPTQVSGLVSGIQTIAAGYYHNCVVNTAGAVQCWGSNFQGQVGDGTISPRSTPVAVTGLGSGVLATVGGATHSCSLSRLGAVQCWGDNFKGQLGDGSNQDRPIPGPVSGLGIGVRAIAAGGQHSCAISAAGAVQCWGYNFNGRLGDGTNSDRTLPVAALGLDNRVVTPGITLRGPPTADEDDLAGTSVAIGDDAASETIIIGAPGAAAGGEVYLHLRPAGSLTSSPASEKAALAESFAKNTAPAVVLAPPAGGGIGDKWGQAVATSPNGSTIAVGAPLHDGNGSVFVFRMPAGGWDSGTPDSPLEISAPASTGEITPQEFGDTLAFAADGTLIVGAPSSDVGMASGAGAAFAYTVTDAAVVPMGDPLIANAPQANARFGDAVAADNGLIAIGAPDESAGAAYLFPTGGGSVGAGVPIQAAGGQIGDKFGAGIAIDKGVVVVGAPGDDTQAGIDSGSGRVFRPGPGGIYNEISVLMPAPGDGQGAGTAVAAQEGTIVLGAPLATAYARPLAGRAYLYQIEDQLLTASETADAILGGGVEDEFGSAVAIGSRRLAIGVPSDSTPDSSGVAQRSIGRTDTFILTGIFRSGFE